MKDDELYFKALFFKKYEDLIFTHGFQINILILNNMMRILI